MWIGRAQMLELVSILPFRQIADTKCDIMTEYRSAIFYHTPEQKSIAEQVTQEIQTTYIDKLGLKIATTIEPAKEWYDAEDYHQEYLFKNPTGYHCPTHREHW